MSIPLTPAELFKDGLDTSEIAERTGRTEAEIYNGGQYRQGAKPVLKPSVEFWPRTRGQLVSRFKRLVTW